MWRAKLRLTLLVVVAARAAGLSALGRRELLGGTLAAGGALAAGRGARAAADGGGATPAASTTYRDDVLGCELRMPARVRADAPPAALSKLSGGRVVNFVGGPWAGRRDAASVQISGSLIPPNGSFRDLRSAFSPTDAAESLLGEYYGRPGVEVVRLETVGVGEGDAFFLEARARERSENVLHRSLSAPRVPSLPPPHAIFPSLSL